MFSELPPKFNPRKYVLSPLTLKVHSVLARKLTFFIDRRLKILLFGGMAA